MEKKLFLALATAFVFAFAPAAEAARQNFGPISLVVPGGWQVAEDENQVTFTAPGNAAAVSVIIDELEGSTLQELAEGVADSLNGSAPVVDSDGHFTFTFMNEHGIDAHAVISGDEAEDFFVLWIVAGEHPDLADLLGSVEEAR